ncbi:MAG: hypothetical protein ACOX88_08545 [Christensenellales bacterium]|jgi:NRPS condensation-like uncharacterized protein
MNERPPKKWMRLDNAAKIYPAAKNRRWTALFRVSANLNEDIDPGVLKAAVKNVLPRFPTFATRLRSGAFWYYMEENLDEPIVEPDVANPMVRMRFNKNNGFGFRVRYYQNRIAVEIFHMITDGTGGMIFLKTLVAEYIKLKYGVEIPATDGVLDVNQKPKAREIEDSFLTHADDISVTRKEKTAYRIRGFPEEDGFINITTGIIPVDIILEKAREKKVSLTAYLVGVLILAIDEIQRRRVRQRRRLKPVKVSVPVNLRSFFKSHTLRNFSSYVNPGIEPMYGEYSFDETLKIIHHFMGTEITAKLLAAKFSTNVQSEKNLILRIMPLFLKNIALKAVFYWVGDRKTSSTISNLGNVIVPEAMAPFVNRFDVILGPLSVNPVACGMLSYGGTLYLNFTRTIRDPSVERAFFTRLVKLGIPVEIESNQRY